MADIDLLLAVSGTEAATSQLANVARAEDRLRQSAEGTSSSTANLYQQMNRLHSQALQGVQAVRGMDSALEILQGKAQFSAVTIIQLSSALPALASPVGLITAAIGFMALETFKLRDAVQKLDEADFQFLLEKIADDAIAAQAGWHAYYDAIISGSQKAQAELAKQAAIEKALFSEEQKRVDAAVKTREQDREATQKQVGALEQLQKVENTELDALEDRRRKLELLNPIEFARALFLEHSTKKRSEQIQTLNNHLNYLHQQDENENKALADQAEKARRAAEALSARNAAIEAHKKFLEELNADLEKLRLGELDLGQATDHYGASLAALAPGLVDGDHLLKVYKTDLEKLRAELDRIEQTTSETFGGKDQSEAIRQNLGFVDSLGAVSDGFMSAIAGAQDWKAALADTGAATQEVESAWGDLGNVAAQQIGNIAAGSFDIYTKAINDAVYAHKFGGKEMAKAIREMFANSVKSIGEDAAVHALYELAMGLAASAIPGGQVAAGVHYAAAAQFGAVAAAAGVAAGLLGGPGGGFAQTGAGGGASPGGTGFSAPGSGGGVTQQIQVVVIGALDDRAAIDLKDQLDSAARRANA